MGGDDQAAEEGRVPCVCAGPPGVWAVAEAGRLGLFDRDGREVRGRLHPGSGAAEAGCGRMVDGWMDHAEARARSSGHGEPRGGVRPGRAARWTAGCAGLYLSSELA